MIQECINQTAYWINGTIPVIEENCRLVYTDHEWFLTCVAIIGIFIVASISPMFNFFKTKIKNDRRKY